MKVNIKIGMFFLALLWVFSATSAVAAPGSQILYETDSIYHHITIRQEGMERCMIFGRQRDLRQTCIDLERPDASVFEYTAMMFAGFLFRPDAKSVCLIGLGGGYIPTVFRMAANSSRKARNVTIKSGSTPSIPTTFPPTWRRKNFSRWSGRA